MSQKTRKYPTDTQIDFLHWVYHNIELDNHRKSIIEKVMVDGYPLFEYRCGYRQNMLNNLRNLHLQEYKKNKNTWVLKWQPKNNV